MPEERVPSGQISEMGILNLLSAKVPEDIAGINSISNVGVVLIPEHLAACLAKIPMTDVGSIASIPTGENINLLIGQITLTGEALAGGDPEKILVVVGQLLIKNVVEAVGYKGIHAIGQICAIRGSEGPLGAKLIHLNGQIIYLPANPRFFMGSETIGKEYLELLPEAEPLVIMGELTIEKEVPAELLKSKIPEIVLMGLIKVPKHLHPLVQVLTKEKMGEIEIYE